MRVIVYSGAGLRAGALDRELGTQLDPLCRALCSLWTTSVHPSQRLFWGEHQKPYFTDTLTEAQE